jgi:ankyrin repeat protein
MSPNDLLSPDLGVVRSCLDNGVDPNSIVGGDADDRRALAVHSYLGDVEIVHLLLECGADPNLGRVSTGETALHHAVVGGGDEETQFEIVTALLRAGGDPNQQARVGIQSVNFYRDVRVRGEAPLHRAAAYSSIAVIQAMLDAGATKELKDANGDSPLTWASLQKRNKDIVKLLCYGEFKVY